MLDSVGVLGYVDIHNFDRFGVSCWDLQLLEK